ASARTPSATRWLMLDTVVWDPPFATPPSARLATPRSRMPIASDAPIASACPRTTISAAIKRASARPLASATVIVPSETTWRERRTAARRCAMPL
ncbi:unnamed protein product, partial [Polarella glacialis]